MLATATTAEERPMAHADVRSSETAGSIGRPLNPTSRERAGPRPVHHRIEVAVQVMVRRTRARGPEESSEHQEAESDRVDVGPRRGDVARRGHEQQERVDAELHQLDVVRDWHENSARAKRTSVLNLC